jgi:hypothetical protein
MKYDDPITPISTGEKASILARTGSSVPCSPLPINSRATLVSRAAIGAITLVMDTACCHEKSGAQTRICTLHRIRSLIKQLWFLKWRN